VRLFAVSPRPEGVGPNDKWIEIRLPEQTVVAYEGDSRFGDALLYRPAQF
jgi:hypothetical protein